MTKEAFVGEPYVWAGSTGPFDCGELVHASITAGEWSPELVTVPNVELVEVGEDWETSTGVFTWEPEDLQSAIASQEDPCVRSPVVKLGHEDLRFNSPNGIAPGDGQPAFGRISNMRVENNGQTLVGDLIGVPRWLADIMPTAYPRRSVEGYFQHKTRTGNTWPFALTGLALLGTAYPAINTLEDLKILWGGTPPPLVEVDQDDAPEVAAAADGLIRARRMEPVAKVKSGKVAGAKEVKEAKATTTTSDVQRGFYDQLESGQMWWWIRQVLVNPLQLVVDDDDGGLYLVDVTVGSDDEITYGEPQAVKVEYVAATQGGLTEVHKDGQIVAASYEGAAESGGKVKAAESGEDDEEEESGMKLSDDAIRALGLKPGATDDEISQAILARAEQNLGGDTTTDDAAADEDGEDDDSADDSTDDADGADESGDESGDTPPATTTPPATGNLQVPEGMVLVDSAQWEQTQQGVAAALRLDKKFKDRERDNFLAAAVKAGKFPRARLDHYKKAWAADAVGTKVVIENLAAGLVPVAEAGNAGGSEDQPVEAAYPENWKSDRRVAAQRQSVSTRVKVVND